MNNSHWWQLVVSKLKTCFTFIPPPPPQCNGPATVRDFCCSGCKISILTNCVWHFIRLQKCKSNQSFCCIYQALARSLTQCTHLVGPLFAGRQKTISTPGNGKLNSFFFLCPLQTPPLTHTGTVTQYFGNDSSVPSPRPEYLCTLLANEWHMEIIPTHGRTQRDINQATRPEVVGGCCGEFGGSCNKYWCACYSPLNAFRKLTVNNKFIIWDDNMPRIALCELFRRVGS